MNQRLVRAKSPGQSIPLIALMMVVLIAMVGLSVDVGNTYAEQRSTVRATDAAALAGMNSMVQGGSDADIRNTIQASLISNGIDAAPFNPEAEEDISKRTYRATYLNAKGVSIGTVGGGSIPAEATYVRVQVDGKVSTYFARIVGRPDLPVNATAYAAKCAPTNGLYPMAVSETDINNNGFTQPSATSDLQFYGTYKDDANPLGRPQRRLYLANNAANNSFNFLSWTTAKQDLNGLVASFTSDGDIDLGYAEAAWGSTTQAAPTKYPLKPGEINKEDWAFGNGSVTTTTGIPAALAAQFDRLKANNTVLLLPIVSAGSGGNVSYLVSDIGSFYLRGYGKNAAGQVYVDLVHLGSANETACLSTPANEGTGKQTNLQGTIFVKPRWGVYTEPRRPVQYQIILDVTGSMSWNINGYGTVNGRDYQCERPSNPNPRNLTYYDVDNGCDGGPNSAWKNVNERRIYVAKQAIFKFIDLMNAEDRMRVTVFSSTGVSVIPSTGWTGDKTLLKAQTQAAGAFNGDPWRTRGGTNGPKAIQETKKVIDAAPDKDPVTGLEYRKVVVYLTDGVSNYFLGTGNNLRNDARDVCRQISENEARNTVDPCQIGEVGGAGSGNWRPVSQMIQQADILKKSDPSMVLYVIAMGPVDEKGLPNTASSAGTFYRASNDAAVQTIFEEINRLTELGGCTPSGAGDWKNRIEGLYKSSTDRDGLRPLPAGVYGYVTLTRDGAADSIQVPITQAPNDAGVLNFSYPNIQPGTYNVQGYVRYKATDDGKTPGDNRIHTYDHFQLPGLTLSPSTSIDVVANDALGNTVTVGPFYLDLSAAEQANICGGGR